MYITRTGYFLSFTVAHPICIISSLFLSPSPFTAVRVFIFIARRLQLGSIFPGRLASNCAYPRATQAISAVGSFDFFILANKLTSPTHVGFELQDQRMYFEV